MTVLKLNPANTLGIKYLMKRIRGKDIDLKLIGEREGLSEYECVIYRPVWYALINNAYSRYTIRKKGLAFVGAVDTDADKKFWRKHIGRLAERLKKKFNLVYGISA